MTVDQKEHCNKVDIFFQVEVKVAQTKEALAQQADKARAAALSHSYGKNHTP